MVIGISVLNDQTPSVLDDSRSVISVKTNIVAIIADLDRKNVTLQRTISILMDDLIRIHAIRCRRHDEKASEPDYL